MAKVICFESGEKERFRFEVTNEALWATIIEKTVNKESSQLTLKRVITKSSDATLVEQALMYYKGNLSFKYLETLLERFAKEGKDISEGVVQYCTINRKKLFLKKFVESNRERLSWFAREVLNYMS